MNFKEITEYLGVAGQVATVINPAVGGGLVLASKALEKFTEMDDVTLEHSFVGLSSLAEDLRHMVRYKEYDDKKLMSIAESMDAIAVISSKISKMLG